MNEKTVIDFLNLQNPWWADTRKFPFKKINEFKRRDYYYLVHRLLEVEEAIVIIGQRGVGKSTAMYEIIRKLLGFSDKLGSPIDLSSVDISALTNSSPVDSKQILYVTFEESNLQKLKILDVLKIFTKYILKKDLSQLDEKLYVFFDEIQNVEDWGTQIKIIQDLKYPIKLFVTGSSSVRMADEASKATRRVNVYSMHPLKFSDFLLYYIRDQTFERILQDAINLRTDLIQAISEKNSKLIYELFLKLYSDLHSWQTQIEIYFQEYLIKGGYPGLLGEKDYLACSTTLGNAFWLGFHKDIVLSQGIGDPRGMKALAEYISSISSNETNYTSLMEKSGGVGSNTDGLKKYLYHLEKMFLVSLSNPFSSSPTRRGSRFKIYLHDVAIRNMLQGMMNELLLNNQEECGIALETLVFDHLVRLYYKLRPNLPLLYWRDQKTNREVDIIAKLNGHSIAIEVKKADSPHLSDVSGLRLFCKKSEVGLVLCGKKIDVTDNIVFLPHWLFMLIC